jgi:hypothetical protein
MRMSFALEDPGSNPGTCKEAKAKSEKINKSPFFNLDLVEHLTGHIL